MGRAPIVYLLLMALAIFSAPMVMAAAPPRGGKSIDALTLGDPGSEQAHRLTADHSEIIHGGLGDSARRLLPLSPVTFDGGSITFTMKIDPQRQNYVTAKFWGSDKGAGAGRLILYADGLEVGYRREGDYDVLNQCDEEGEAPGRYFYQTLLLPPGLTQGKTSIRLKIAALGPMWYYGTTFAQYQKDLTQPSRGIYRVYTHTADRFVPDASEKQGHMPDAGVRPSPGEEVIEESKQVVIGRLRRLLAHPAMGAHAGNRRDRAARLLLMAEAYNTPWTPAYHNSRVIDQIVLDGDSMAGDFAGDPKYVAQDWPGAGPLGEAIMRTWPAIGARLDESVTIVGQTGPRRDAWAGTLRQSVDYWRTNRRSYTNQSMIVDRNIYTANRALELISPRQALPETQALDYLYQAVGIEPWLGSDPASDDGQIADAPGKGVSQPFGDHYFLVTRKGLSRELGWVGTYGETILRFTHDMVQLTGDPKIRAQLARFEAARMYFRYPGVDADGYRCMKLVSEIDNRTAHYPLSGSAYSASQIREEWWMDVPAMLKDDSVAVGAAQQALADNQYFAYVQSRLKDPDTLGMMRNVDDYAAVKALPPSSYRLPMTDGQPDFVFADEQDAVLAIKHGDTRLFVNFYYRAERGVNDAARVYELTPNITRIATVRTETQIVWSGHTYTRPDWIDSIRSKGLPPPGEDIHQAWAGDRLPISARPADAKLPAYGDWGPFVGKADFYRLQYGDYLIGMNCSETRAYSLVVPRSPGGLMNLVSKRRVAATTGLLSVPPMSTVVLYLGE